MLFTVLPPSLPPSFLPSLSLLLRKVIPVVPISLFTPWVLTFSQEVISLATQYPLVSGFYKLLTVCLSICNKIQYFEVSGVWYN